MHVEQTFTSKNSFNGGIFYTIFTKITAKCGHLIPLSIWNRMTLELLAESIPPSYSKQALSSGDMLVFLVMVLLQTIKYRYNMHLSD